MLISAQIIWKPRRVRSCAHCDYPLIGPTLRLFGAAEKGDKPYPLYLHPECTDWSDPKVIKAKAALELRPAAQTVDGAGDGAK